MTKPSRSIIHFLTWSPLVFIPMVVIMVLLLVFSAHDEHFQQTMQTIESDLMETEHQAVKAKVDGVVDWVDFQQSIIKDNLTSRVQDRVETAYKIATSIIEQYENDRAPEEIQKIIITTLRPLVWNQGESFIFMLDYDGVFKLAPNYLRHLEGTSILNFQDATGRYVIKEEIELAQKKGGGFLWDTFTKPDDPSGKQYDQVAYVKALGHYDWYLGSAEYLETASSKTNEELLNSIEKIGSKARYLFVLNDKGEGLLNPSLALDRSQLDTSDMRIQKVMQQNLDAVKTQNAGFITYDWINPQTNQIEKKFTYVRKTAQKDWLIGSGFYESEIKAKADQKAVTIYTAYREKLYEFMVLSLVWFFIALLIGYLLSRYIGRRFVIYQNEISQKTDELEHLNKDLEGKVQQRTYELEASKKAYESLAKTDALTGIGNRYAIMQTLEEERKRVERTQDAFSVMMFDVDHFKAINDNHGHDAGDEVLKKLAMVVSQNLRDIDGFGRYGGEEFMVTLPYTNLEKALNFAKRISEEIEATDFAYAETITVSSGVAEYQQGENVMTFIKRLDELLYHSKKAGRNRVSS